ncbi:hypothetical protein NPIL_456421, partial [Nephila pilipes]
GPSASFRNIKDKTIPGVLLDLDLRFKERAQPCTIINRQMQKRSQETALVVISHGGCVCGGQ